MYGKYETKSEIFLLMAPSYCVLFFVVFPLACFRVEMQLSRWLVCGRNVLSRNGCLTKNPHGAQKQGEQNNFHDIFTFQVVMECAHILQLLESNKLTNNCSHLWIAQVGAVVSHKFPGKILYLWTVPFWVHVRSYKCWVFAENWLFF